MNPGDLMDYILFDQDGIIRSCVRSTSDGTYAVATLLGCSVMPGTANGETEWVQGGMVVPRPETPFTLAPITGAAPLTVAFDLAAEVADVVIYVGDPPPVDWPTYKPMAGWTILDVHQGWTGAQSLVFTDPGSYAVFVRGALTKAVWRMVTAT